MAKENEFRTDYKIRMEKRNLSIYEEYNRLTAEPGVSKGKVEEYLMKKYDISSRSTIWAIRKQMEAKMREAAI